MHMGHDVYDVPVCVCARFVKCVCVSVWCVCVRCARVCMHMMCAYVWVCDVYMCVVICVCDVRA